VRGVRLEHATLFPRTQQSTYRHRISRLLHAHEIVIKEARTMARLASAARHEGTNDVHLEHATGVRQNAGDTIDLPPVDPQRRGDKSVFA
jgi:hypothetical protein